MKTWAIVISFLVVAYLNASVFDIYKNVTTNDALRNQLVQMGEERTKANEQRLAKAKEDEAKQSGQADDQKEKKQQSQKIDDAGRNPQRLRRDSEANRSLEQLRISSVDVAER